MKKLYTGLMWLVMFLIIIDLLCACFNWVVASLIVSILLVVSVIAVVFVYMRFGRFKCTKCGTIFKGGKWEIFFAPHTATKRKMHCPMCNERLWCEDWFDKS